MTWQAKIVKAPPPNQWARFRRHALRVRTFFVDTKDTVLSVDGEPYGNITQYYPESLLFPNLRKVYSQAMGLSEGLIPFAQPSLCKALFILQKATDIALLDRLADHAPALEVLGLNIFLTSPLLLPTLTRAICSWNNLTNVWLTVALEAEAQRHLSQLSNLLELSLTLVESNCVPLPPSDGPGPLFPSLDNLVVNCCNIPLPSPRRLFDWILSIHPPRLTTMYISPPFASSDAPAVRRLFSILATFSTLEDLQMSFGHIISDMAIWRSPDFTPPAAEEILSPLLKGLPHMRRLQLHTLPLDWTVSSLKSVASSWPHLVSLMLPSSTYWPSRVQVPDLLPFAKHCPDLERLAIYVQPHMPTDLSDTENSHQQGISSSALRSLALGRVVFEPEVIPQVAAFLEKHFPCAVLDDTIFAENYFEVNGCAAKINRLRGMRREDGVFDEE